MHISIGIFSGLGVQSRSLADIAAGPARPKLATVAKHLPILHATVGTSLATLLSCLDRRRGRRARHRPLRLQQVAVAQLDPFDCVPTRFPQSTAEDAFPSFRNYQMLVSGRLDRFSSGRCRMPGCIADSRSTSNSDSRRSKQSEVLHDAASATPRRAARSVDVRCQLRLAGFAY